MPRPVTPTTIKPRALIKSGTTDVDVIVQDARRAVEAVAGRLDHGACLYLAMASIIAAKRRGIVLVPQAGTAAFWRMGDDFVDDGVTNTHFSYVWSGGVPDKRVVDLTAMPVEIHVWAGDPTRNEIVDLSTGGIPRACVEVGQHTWEAPAPPDYLWGRSLPGGWAYDANAEATLFAVEVAMQGGDDSLLRKLRRALPPLTGSDSSYARLKAGKGLL